MKKVCCLFLMFIFIFNMVSYAEPLGNLEYFCRIEAEKVYPVYKAPHWVFCRYSDDIGAAVTSVRAEYMPMWKELVEMIPFEAWIYDSAEGQYAVDFSRTYVIIPQFRVIDTKGNVGKTTIEGKEVSVS